MRISFSLIIGEYKLKDKVVKVIDKTTGFVLGSLEERTEFKQLSGGDRSTKTFEKLFI